MENSTTELFLAAAAGAVVGAGLVVLTRRKPASGATATSGNALALQNTASVTGSLTDLTVSPGTLNQVVILNSLMVIWLPLGGKWVSADGAGITDPVSPQAFVFQGPITHTYVWTDSTNTTRTTVVNFTAGQQTPITTTT